MRPSREICCISTGRTGSNYLFDGATGIRNLLVSWEVFNRARSHVGGPARRAIESRHGLGQEALDRLAREDKARLLALLRQARRDLGRQHFMYKVFPLSKHLSFAELEALVFSAPGARVFCLVRNPLRVYLSRLKARRVGAFKNVRTDTVTVTVNLDDLFRQLERIEHMYSNVDALCEKHDKTCPALSYEDVFARDTYEDRLAFFVNELNTSLDLDLERAEQMPEALKKQDRSPLTEAIENFDEVASALAHRGLHELLEDSQGYRARYAPAAS